MRVNKQVEKQFQNFFFIEFGKKNHISYFKNLAKKVFHLPEPFKNVQDILYGIASKNNGSDIQNPVSATRSVWYPNWWNWFHEKNKFLKIRENDITEKMNF